MYAIHRNSYLQAVTAPINGAVINRSVSLARKYQGYDEDYLQESAYYRLCSEQPCIPLGNVDFTKRAEAFGRWALPKLRRELHHPDELIVAQSVTTLCDLLHDPEKGYEALRLRIPDRLADLIIHPNAGIRERVLLSLTIIANLADGKTAIVANRIILANLAAVLNDEERIVRVRNANLLETIALYWKTGDALVDFGFIPFILEVLPVDADEVVVILLQVMKMLMYCCDGKETALDNDGFDVFFNLLDHKNETIVGKALDCLMILIQTPIGKNLSSSLDMLEILNRMLYVNNLDIQTAAAAALMFAVIDSRERCKAARIPNLPYRLINLAQNKLNPSLQIYCLKTLISLCEHPRVRNEVLTKYLKQVWRIQLDNDPYIALYRQTLIDVINWLPCHGN